jgi:hypothetical protein
VNSRPRKNSDFGQNQPEKHLERIVVVTVSIAMVIAIAFGTVAYASNFFSAQGEEQSESVVRTEPSNDESVPTPMPKNVQTGLIALEDDKMAEAFALWSRGRFAVTSPEGKGLAFEVSPLLGHVGVWGSLGVDGDVTILGTSELGKVVAAGDVDMGRSATVQGALQAGDISATNAVFSTVRASLFECEEILSTKLMAIELTAQAGKFSDLVGETITANLFKAAAALFDSAQIQELTSEMATIQMLETQTLIAQMFEGESIKVQDLFATYLVSDEAQIASCSTTHIDAQTLEVEELAAQSIRGILQEVELASQCCGSVSFPPIDTTGDGVDAPCSIVVPAGTTAVFVQPTASGGDWVCAWEVEQVSPTLWSIVRRFPKLAEREMGEGIFTPVGETLVYWFAVTAR